MKHIIVFFFAFFLIPNLRAQSNCILQPGDSCRVSTQGAEFRTKPNYGYKVLATINGQNIEAIAMILQSRLSQGYVKVKLVSLEGDTAGLGHLYHAIAWVKKKYLNCQAAYGNHDIADTSTKWDEDIQLAEQYRKNKLCKYSAKKHAQLLLERARAKYREEAYESAVEDIDRAIEILPYSDNLIIYHWYRAHARSEMGDLYDAIADFDYIIDRKDSLAADEYDFNLEEVLCWKAQNLYLAGEQYKAKSIVNIVITSEPENGFAYYLRGLIKYSLDDVPGGCKDLKIAAAIGFEEAIDEIQLKCQ
jgi:tetratricopeptide (TPR) repeat protein